MGHGSNGLNGSTRIFFFLWRCSFARPYARSYAKASAPKKGFGDTRSIFICGGVSWSVSMDFDWNFDWKTQL